MKEVKWGGGCRPQAGLQAPQTCLAEQEAEAWHSDGRCQAQAGGGCQVQAGHSTHPLRGLGLLLLAPGRCVEVLGRGSQALGPEQEPLASTLTYSLARSAASPTGAAWSAGLGPVPIR